MEQLILADGEIAQSLESDLVEFISNERKAQSSDDTTDLEELAAPAFPGDTPLVKILSQYSRRTLTAKLKAKVNEQALTVQEPDGTSRNFMHTLEWYFANKHGFPNFVQARIDAHLGITGGNIIISNLIGDLRHFNRCDKPGQEGWLGLESQAPD